MHGSRLRVLENHDTLKLTYFLARGFFFVRPKVVAELEKC